MQHLPRKLNTSIYNDRHVDDDRELPVGWGIYIVDGLDEVMVALVNIVFTVVLFIASGTYWAMSGDGQTATGLFASQVAAWVMLMQTLCLVWPSREVH